MAKKKDPDADFRHAKDELVLAVRAEVNAELAWMRDRHNTDLAVAHRAAVDHTRWCRCLVLACGEVVKGRPFEECI